MLFSDLLVLSATVALWASIVYIIKEITRKPESRRIIELERENAQLRKRLKDEIEDLRNHYEQLLRDAAIKNALMTALYNAWRRGELRKCYAKGGDVRILADGTILCSRERLEESYTIEEDGEDDAQ